MLQRLKVERFKSLHTVEVQLSKLVVLFGPNASGKSNLLEAILLLSRLTSQRTVAEAFAPPLRGYPLEAFAMPRGGLGELIGRDASTMRLEADCRAAHARLRYGVEVGVRPRSGEFFVQDEHLTRLNSKGEPGGNLPRISKEWVVDGGEERLVVRRKGGAGHPVHEKVGLNHTLVSNLQYAGVDRFPDFDAIRGEMAGWRLYYLDPAVAMRAPQPPREVTDIGAHGELIAPFLYRLKNSDAHRGRFDAVRRALMATIPTVEGLDVDLDRERGTLDIRVRQGGVDHSSRVISEGTLRVLALCAIAANPWTASLIAFEEPENGVHPRRVETVARLLSGMARRSDQQVVITTHSPLMVAELLREARKEKGLVTVFRCARFEDATRIEALGDDGPLFDRREIDEALRSPEDVDDPERIARLLARGWLDA